MPPFSPLTITSPQMHPIRTPRSRRQSSPRPISFFTFKWKHASKEVYVTGTFDNWSCSIPMKRTTIDGEEFEATIALDRTQDIEFKFVADGVWRCGF
ncbi:hypothetical protein BC829DRAFT_385118 [Chytridium lagenaria]|nr:hypothetical protein BC829DRAFT_385118 [Chytridium lagenaria]